MLINSKMPQIPSNRPICSDKKLCKSSKTQQGKWSLDKANISPEAQKAIQGADPNQISGFAKNFGNVKTLGKGELGQPEPPLTGLPLPVDPHDPFGAGDGLGKPVPPSRPESEPFPTRPVDPHDPIGAGDGLPKSGGGIKLPGPTWKFRPGYNPAGTGGL